MQASSHVWGAEEAAFRQKGQKQRKGPLELAPGGAGTGDGALGKCAVQVASGCEAWSRAGGLSPRGSGLSGDWSSPDLAEGPRELRLSSVPGARV